MQRLVRDFSIAALLAMVLAGTAVIAIYRSAARHEATLLAVASNKTLAHATLNAVLPSLLRSLPLGLDSSHGDVLPLPPEIFGMLREIQETAGIARIKVYDTRGVVLYSTVESDIGHVSLNDEGVRRALTGESVGDIAYRDLLNAYEKETENTNLIETYIPIRAKPGGPVLGVFELYSDGNALVSELEWTGIKILFTAIAIFAVLYVLLVFFVERAARTIESQKRTIEEKNQLLQALSAQRIRSEEGARRRVATELHEHTLQTLGAIKFSLEHARETLVPASGASKSLEALVPVIQGAMQEVRAVAQELRPPGLDDFGLIATLTWLAREYRVSHPLVAVELQIPEQNHEIPAPLRIIVFRIAETGLEDAIRVRGAGRVMISLEREDESIRLAINDDGRAGESLGGLSVALDGDEPGRVETMQAHAVLSGGSFSVNVDPDGGTTVCAIWDQAAVRADPDAVVMAS